MKRLLTLLFFAGITTVVMAQPPRPNPYGRQNGPVATRSSQYIGKSYHYSSRERDRDIAKVYRKFSRKIRSAGNRLFASRYKKVNEINRLERERDLEIGKINAKFYSRRNSARR
ncbi:MAG: hypothetical protein JNN29_09060 [Chitinophagaceae bacterium]|nr:hypothetical protein [Chitinophagaceae bacterium]MBN8668208.1 hypothetical protein [Chitinophagales bacterium]